MAEDKPKPEKAPAPRPIPIDKRCGKCGDWKHKGLCSPWN